MKKKTTKQIGAILENYVLAKVKELDPQARLSRGSGCGNDYSDITSSLYFIECKKRNTKDFTIREDVWNHLNNNLPINTKKICFMVHENKNGKRLVTLDCEDFFSILENLQFELDRDSRG
jgi:hypothetical protein